MIRRSNQKRAALTAAMAHAVPALQDATDAIDDAAAHVLGVNRTDLRAMGVLARGGTTSPSSLAAATGLSRGAMTTALDRLEQAGYVRRVPDPKDRRGVRIELTGKATRRIGVIWGPIAREGKQVLRGYSNDELVVILRFLEQAHSLQERHVARIRALRTAPKR